MHVQRRFSSLPNTKGSKIHALTEATGTGDSKAEPSANDVVTQKLNLVCAALEKLSGQMGALCRSGQAWGTKISLHRLQALQLGQGERHESL